MMKHPRNRRLSWPLALAAAALACISASAGEKTRVACVGDSITQGSGYVNELGKLLGPDYDVVNFGVPSTTLLFKAERPYVKEKAYQAALAFNPHLVVIMLGTNDTKPQNYKFLADWSGDYRKLIDSFAALETKPKVYLCLPVPVYYDGNWGIDDGRLTAGVIPAIRKVAEQAGLPLIDLYAALSNRPDLFYKDNVHPIGGQVPMAAAVYKALTGKDAAVETVPPPPEPTRVACLGDSITEGSGYADALQGLLGNRYLIVNPGFEEGIAPWSTRGGAIAVVGEPVRSGAKALRNTGRKAAWCIFPNI